MNNDVTDTASWQKTEKTEELLYDEVVLTSCYVEMRDNVKIAVDIYLPKGLDTESKLPAILHQTRYFRRQKYNFISKILRFKKNAKRKIIDRYVKNGYAYINVDVRGSGASFGLRKMEWSPDEVKDGAELVNWITKQPWSNGKVAVTGMSYTATAAEMLLINNHPAVKAAVIQYSLFDIYPDILMPGGIHNESFMRKWAMLNKFRDMNVLPEAMTKLKKTFFKLLINGVAPVLDNKDGLEQLKAAEEEHKQNYDIYAYSREIKYRDDIGPDGIVLDKFSPHMFIKEIEKSKTPIYSWSGWYDGAYPRSAINRYLNIKTPGSRLILGPWDHAGNHTADPFVQNSKKKTNFDYVEEILCFLNKHLKTGKGRIESKDPIHYYTIGENKWKTAKQWPVPGFTYTSLYLADDSKLSLNKSALKKIHDKYIINNSATSGNVSRWISQVNVEKKRIQYKNLYTQSKVRLLYDSSPLKEDLEVTGHPLISLFIKANVPDIQLFVYLEDIQNTGEINYVTEGVFRTIHRKTASNDFPYKTPVPCHSFKGCDVLPLKLNEIAEITFDLFPISYQFKKENSIRISIAGADKDNFEIFPTVPPEMEVCYSQTYPSCIQLPTNTKPLL